ncbi:hypothetical protein HOA55_00725 [archaeon]|jgi:hypothetical protein|nr:hypothetical protein [archaeon]MBT3578220.1 hypothetical protein [archaeon]MBT6819859.1 hypothetical protein [archaeon]MBT6956581.1 hypothetical protein [archaeon]MBT7025641.1 hypothetical protein [archaeon]
MIINRGPVNYDPSIPSIFSEEGALRVATLTGEAYDRFSLAMHKALCEAADNAPGHPFTESASTTHFTR